MEQRKVMHRCGPTEVQEVLTGPFVTGTFALPLVHPRYGLFHAGPLPKGLAALRCWACLTPLDAQRCVRMYPERTATCRRRPIRLQGTGPAGRGGKRGPALGAPQAHGLARGTPHLVPMELALKRFFGKVSPVVPGPGLGDDLDAWRLARANQRPAEVRAVQGAGAPLALGRPG
jgi:hypothetical protein